MMAIRQSLVRLGVGYGAILCALPYLALKLIWLAGGQLGIANPALINDSTMVALNVATAFMDIVAIAIALAFTHEWGLQIPAWLLVPPMWVATGLLTRFVVIVPITAISQLIAREPIRIPPGGPVQPWVYAVVYIGFTGMGIGLMFAFVLYARARWRAVFDALPSRDARLDSVDGVVTPLAVAGAVMALAASMLPLAWTLGSTIGIPADVAAGRTFSSYLLSATDAAMGVGAAAGVMTIVGRTTRRRFYTTALIVAWIGSGALFAWGLWHLINVLGNTALLRDRVQGMALVNLTSLVRSLAGLVIGIVTLVVMARNPNKNRDLRDRNR